MKKSNYVWMVVCCMGLFAASVQAAVIVYEGFDYTDGALVAGQGTAVNGWDGAWTTAEPAEAVQYAVTTGATFGALPVSGGAAQRLTRFGDHEISRLISSASQAALTADNTTIWFSVLMAPRSAQSGASFALNSWGAIVLGNTGFINGTGSNVSAAYINPGGSAVGVSFAGSGGGDDFNNMRIQGVTYKDGVLTEYLPRPTVGDTLVMVVGKVEWAANGTDDIVSLYLIEDSTAPLPLPFVVMPADLDQTTFNVVAIGQSQCELFDEIRFGETYVDVTYSPTPGNGEAILAANPLTLNWVNRDPVADPNGSVYVDVWFGTEPNVLMPTYDWTKIVDANTPAGQDATSVDVDASVLGTYYWRVDTFVNGPANINEQNRIEGALCSFDVVADVPPLVTIDTLDQMTWSGKAVPLQATVIDDNQSPVTIAWAADAASLADPNLAIAITGGDTAAPTVTITKDVPVLGLRTVTMTVTVSDESGDPAVTDSVEIDVYDNACAMARLGEDKVGIDTATYVTDYNGDCVTNLTDFVEMAAAWLGDYSSTDPMNRP